MQTMQIWECIWSGHRSHNFELFIVLAINELYCGNLSIHTHTENILEHFVHLSMKMNVKLVLAKAREV